MRPIGTLSVPENGVGVRHRVVASFVSTATRTHSFSHRRRPLDFSASGTSHSALIHEPWLSQHMVPTRTQISSTARTHGLAVPQVLFILPHAFSLFLSSQPSQHLLVDPRNQAPHNGTPRLSAGGRQGTHCSAIMARLPPARFPKDSCASRLSALPHLLHQLPASGPRRPPKPPDRVVEIIIHSTRTTQKNAAHRHRASAPHAVPAAWPRRPWPGPHGSVRLVHQIENRRRIITHAQRRSHIDWV